jgi:hypothetical protein
MEDSTALPIEPEEATQEDLNNWYILQEQLEKVKEAELILRKKICKFYFRDPKEGVNKYPLDEGWVMKCDHKINRTVDESLLTTLSSTLREKGINPEALVKWKPELKLAEYRKLTEEERNMFDKVLTIKDGTPALEIVLPKR